jgi:hypothetical protein
MFTRRNDDELITAYLDGQLDDRARREFEARMNSEVTLRQRVETTRLLVQSARITTTPSAPRNFTLPRTMQTQQQPAPPPRMLWRLASGLAAAVFVIALGLDASGSLRPAAPAMAPAPLIAATNVTEAPAQAAAAVQVESTSTAPPPYQTQASDSAESTPPALSAKRAISETPASAMAAMAAVAPVTQTEELSPTTLMAVIPEATIEVTPTLEPTPQTIVEPVPVEPAPDLSWVVRIVAGLALLIAVGAGILGWLRR